MGRQRLLQWYHNYALVLGVTSHRHVAGRTRQTWLTRAYALILNVLTLVTLPFMFWQSITYINTNNFMPNLIPYTSCVLYSVSYATTSYTIISRGVRDCALLELELIVIKIMKQQNQPVGRTLNCIFYLKFITMILVCLNSMVLSILIPKAEHWSVLVITFLFEIAMIIPTVASYRYFLALWYIARTYQSINDRLDQLMRNCTSRLPLRRELDELYFLWSQHAMLGRCTLRINKLYELLLLAGRFDYLTFGVIHLYWGAIYMFSIKVPLYMVSFGAFNYWIRFIDFYLMDAMCDLMIQYQNSPHHSLSEVHYFKEMNDFLLYASATKFDVWICGLFTANRSRWFKMFGSIVSFATLLMQFHLLLKDNFSI